MSDSRFDNGKNLEQQGAESRGHTDARENDARKEELALANYNYKFLNNLNTAAVRVADSIQFR